MKNLTAVIFCTLLLIAGCNSDGGGDGGGDGDQLVSGAGSEGYSVQGHTSEYKMWEHDEILFADADKTGAGDTNMCWVAAAANMLAWTEWASDEDDAFNIFYNHFENKAGYVYLALRYYFANYVPHVSAEMVVERELRAPKVLEFIVRKLNADEGLAIKIIHPAKKTVGHFLSIYGYSHFAEEDFYILYFTDSDDGLHQIQQFKVVWNAGKDRWEADDRYRGYTLEYAIALTRR